MPPDPAAPAPPGPEDAPGRRQVTILRNAASPSHDSRKGTAVDMLVLHYTDTADAATAIGLLTDAANSVSAHYLVDVDGSIRSLVPEDRRAWHAGVASWCGITDINACSIGIEIQNRGHSSVGASGPEPYPLPQIRSVIDLIHDIRRRHAIPDRRVLGHSDVAPLRKQDPGAHFPWARLAGAGIGIWPSGNGGLDQQPTASVTDVQQALAAIGYGIAVDGVSGPQMQSVVAAFQRHFLPDRVTGTADADTVARIGVVGALMCAVP